MGQGYFDVAPWHEGTQRILNAHEVPARRAQRDARTPIRVHARLVWERDGEQVIATIAHAWTTRLVLVEVNDPQAQIRGAWLSPDDVARITEPGNAPP